MFLHGNQKTFPVDVILFFELLLKKELQTVGRAGKLLFGRFKQMLDRVNENGCGEKIGYRPTNVQLQYIFHIKTVFTGWFQRGREEMRLGPSVTFSGRE